MTVRLRDFGQPGGPVVELTERQAAQVILALQAEVAEMRTLLAEAIEDGWQKLGPTPFSAEWDGNLVAVAEALDWAQDSEMYAEWVDEGLVEAGEPDVVD